MSTRGLERKGASASRMSQRAVEARTVSDSDLVRRRRSRRLHRQDRTRLVIVALLAALALAVAMVTYVLLTHIGR